MATKMLLAPMYDVTDHVFREIMCDVGKPDVMFTEFVNVEALTSEGRESQIKKLEFSARQKPIIAQVWGVNPENYKTVANELVGMGFDGIDINMGCPQKDVIKTGSCSALINNHELAKQIIEATIEGACGLPVSVKTRTGIKRHQTEEWIRFLLQFDIKALTLHGRTVKQMSKVPANWDEIKKAVDIRDELGVQVEIFGNGDIETYTQAQEYAQKYGVDGVMVGRGVFTNIGIFAHDKVLSKKERFEVLLKHAKLFEDFYLPAQAGGEGNKFYVMRKYFKIYIRDFDGANELRARLMEANNYADLEKIMASEVAE